MLRQYKIVSVLGAGGFGITYLVRDETLDKLFAVKEYYPDDFASRNGGTIKPKTANVADFTWAKERFIEEARILARFDHPNIVKVVQIFEANNTAYIVQDYESGRDLKVWLAEIGDAPTQLELDCIAEPLLLALQLVHRNELLHRDVAPDNIYIRDDGTPVLLDFGSAKDALAQRTKNISAVVKPGYSPPELYSSRGRNQGPWSDNYSLAATLYFLITGERPQEATERLLTDHLAPAATVANGDYRPAFLDAIDWALKISPKNRPQSIAEWGAALFTQDTPTNIESRVALVPPAEPKIEIVRTSHIKPATAKPESIEADIAELVGAVARTTDSKPANAIPAVSKAAKAKTKIADAESASAAVASQQSAPPRAQPTPNAVPAKKLSRLGAALSIAATIAIIAGAGIWLEARQAGPLIATPRGTGMASAGVPTQQPPADTIRELEAKAFFKASGNRRLLARYIKTCIVCGYKFEAKKQISAIEEKENQNRIADSERSTYQAAQGSGALLKRYLQECRLCQFSAAAQDEITKIDQAEYQAARGNIERLRAYVRDCNSCGSLAAAKAGIAALAIASSGQIAALGGPFTPADHWTGNGSILELVSYDKDPSRRTFNYRIPNDELRRRNVHKGDPFFEGRRSNKEYKGIVFHYSNDCGRMSYSVVGTVSEDERSVSLVGSAPVPDNNCRTVRYERRQFVLVFHDKEDNWGRATQ